MNVSAFRPAVRNGFALLVYLLAVHASALLVLTLFRCVFWHVMAPQVGATSAPVATAFVRGLWFDNVIACYVMLPALVAAAVCLVAGGCRGLLRCLGWWFGVAYALVFMCAAANVPYFDYFSKTLNSSIWEWRTYVSQTAGMVFGEASWRPYILLWVMAVAAFAVWLLFLRRCAAKRLRATGPWRLRLSTLLLTLPLAGLCVFGMRGRTGYNPIKVSAAYYCDNTVLNQMGVNAAFSLLTSTLDDLRPENRTLHLADPEQSVAAVQAALGRTGIDGISPIARVVAPRPDAVRKNVVVVLMESMSALLMERFGNPDGLTPNLDSLFARGLSFANCYSAGNHTNHGLYATLYGFPSILKRNAMKGSNIPLYSGLPTVLHDAGYRTLFFMTHEGQYDNMNAFFRTNGYDEVFSEENYPRDKRANHFGVPDDYLFSYALPVLRERAAAGPFFATLLTISNHPPYVIPKDFPRRHAAPEKAIVEYADAAVGDFMRACAKEPWFANTVFVFLGDHGKKMGDTRYEVPEAFNHIPLIFLNTGLPAEVRTDFCGQLDVMPTLLGLLGVGYTQVGFGVDLLAERRPMMFYSADDVVCARSDGRLYIYSPAAEREFCYDTSVPGRFRPVPFSAPYAALRSHVFSQLQAAEALVQAGHTLDHPH